MVAAGRGAGFTCDQVKQKRKTVSIDGYEDVPASDESALRKAVSMQPVSVAICASDLQFYGSGARIPPPPGFNFLSSSAPQILPYPPPYLAGVTLASFTRLRART